MPDTAPRSALLGRDRELKDVLALLDQASLVTLTGPAGVGKSRLAAALAAEGRWAGCATVDLADVADGAQEMLQAAVAGLERVPGDRLLVVDNCDRQLGEVACFIAGLRDGPQVLTTSRECVGAGDETVCPVGPLPPADAASFFLARAAAGRGGVASESSPEVREICARLDGLPLALELAAAQTAVLTPAQIVARLDDAMRLLVGGLRTGPAHHRSLRAALEWGASGLSEAERVLLRRVSVFAGELTLDVVEQVCSDEQLPVPEVLQALAGLVAKSFVECDRGGEQARYRLLRTVRRYADGLLGEAGERERVQRARLGYATAHPAHLEPADLSEALTWCAAHDAVADGLRLAAAAAPYWLLSGRVQEGAALLTAQLARADAAGLQGTAGYAHALLAQGMFAVALGRMKEAQEAAARARGLPEGGAWSDVLIGASLVPGDPHAAARRLAAAAQALPASSWTPVAEALQAVAEAESQQPEQARATARRALDRARETGLPQPVLAALLATGTVARKQGRFTAARAALAEAESLADEHTAKGARLLVLTEWCRLALEEGPGPGGDTDEAPDAGLDRALALAAEVDSPMLLASVWDVAGRSRLAYGLDGPARAAFAQVTAISRETVTAHAAAGILGLGEVALAGGSAGAAWTLIEEAHALARGGARAALLARTLQGMGHCARALGDAARAWSAYHQALGVRAANGLQPAAVKSLEALAGLALEQARTEYGVRLLGAAQGLRETLGSRRPDPAQRRFEADLAAAGRALPGDRFTELYAEGRRLTLAEAVGYAGRQRGPRRHGVGWVSLTPAERQVADLAATGLTNREIGERLFTSPRTVQTHLSHVFAKLGINSRRMLAEQIEARHRQLRSAEAPG